MPKKYVKPINRYSWYHAQDLIEEVIPDGTLPIGVASLPEGTLLYRDTEDGRITIFATDPDEDTRNRALGVLVNHSVVDEELANIAVRGTFGDAFLRQTAVTDRFEADTTETEFELSHELQTLEGLPTIHGVFLRDQMATMTELFDTSSEQATFTVSNDIDSIVSIEQWVPATDPTEGGTWTAIPEGDSDPNGWEFDGKVVTLNGTAEANDGTGVTPADGEEDYTLRITYEYDPDSWSRVPSTVWSIEKSEDGWPLLVFSTSPPASDTDEADNIRIVYDGKPTTTEIHMFEPAIVIRPILETVTEITHLFLDHEEGEE